MKRSTNTSSSKSSAIEAKKPKLPETNIHVGGSRTLSVKCEKYDRPFPYFRKPTETGRFSQDHERNFHHDRRQLRYYIKPTKSDPCFDLRQGYTSRIRKDESVKEYLDDMLRWVMMNKEKFMLQSDKNQLDAKEGIDSLHTDFVCWRGLLTRLMCTPYENKDDWKIAVTKFRGTYFLCEFETERKKQREEQMTQQQDEMSYWGWKFEQYVTADKPNGRPDTDRPVNNNEGFCSVVRSRLHSHSLVFGGEVDGVDSSIPGDNKYLELKTSRIMQARRQEQNFRRFKLIKWWAQSFLLGITKIIAGFRDDDGIVHSLEEYQTQKIPSLTKDIHNPWQPNVCFNFLEQVLGFIKETVTTDDPKMVHLLTWSPGKDLECRCLGRDSSYVFLPDWFLHWEGWSADK
ncbi:decapping and exoribonuclease protein-like [Littorina saxatilis]|uniref:Decapping nuclease n=1 Tax=Littorina saxatilis TaxID=31220 RepID=A0AAN9AU83_9CAEN